MRFLGYLTAFFAIAWMLHRFNSTPADWFLAAQSVSPWLFVSAVFFFSLHTFANANAFCCYVSTVEPSVSRLLLYAAWRDSLLAKYLPGGVWQIAGRWLLLKKAGVTHGLVMQASLFEQGLALSFCALLGGAFWLLSRNPVGLGWLFLILPVVSVLVWCAVHLMCRLASKLLPLVGRRFDLSERFWNVGALQRMAFVMLGAMMPFALGYLFVFAPMLNSGDDIFRLLAAIFLATSAGLAVVFVPGGLGLRESILPIVFTFNSTDAARALSLGVVTRVVLVVSEVIVFALMGRLRPSRT